MMSDEPKGQGVTGAFDAFAATARAGVDARLASWLDDKVAAAREHGPEVAAVVDAVRSLAVRGGKRWRAVMLAAAYEGLGGEGGAGGVVLAGVAVELLQVYLLIHDDWMDGDAVRRGGPSVHAALADRLGSEKRGAAAAVLAGDHAAALAHEALMSLPLAAARVRDAARELARIEHDVTLGQARDLLGASSLDVEATYRLKTGSYTVRGPLLIGAALAGASPDARAALERFAAPLGVAFQLRDDLLGVFGDPRVTGKPSGSDLREGKRTPLVDELGRSGEAGPLLARVLGARDASAADVDAVTRLLVASGARARVEARLDALVAEAENALADAAIPEWLRTILAGAVHKLGHRER
jgi:geranylgeranyl diphosphate synthase type I